MEKHVYIDESGDECLELSLASTSSFYVVCALVIEADDLQLAINRFTEVRDRYFCNQEMKSSSLKSVERRERILQELLGAKFKLLVLVGNKRLLTSPGFRYPKSFIKYLHGFLYKEVMKGNSGVHIRADRIKNPAFTSEMQGYLERNGVIGGLFDNPSFGFSDSKSEICIQAADFIAGSIRGCFERNEHNAMSDPIMKQLWCHIEHLLPFPDAYHRYIKKLPGFEEHDCAIEAWSVMTALDFLRTHGAEEDIERSWQVLVLRELLLALKWNDEHWVKTGFLMNKLNAISQEPISEQAFRNVIGKLRDAGLLVASRTAGGYKLATSMRDITEFLNRQNSQLAPMIDRVRLAQGAVRRATNNAVDILAPAEFANLQNAVATPSPWPYAGIASHIPALVQHARPVTDGGTPVYSVVPAGPAQNIGSAFPG